MREDGFREFVSWMVEVGLDEFVAFAGLISQKQILSVKNAVSKKYCVYGLDGSFVWKPRDVDTFQLPFLLISGTMSKTRLILVFNIFHLLATVEFEVLCMLFETVKYRGAHKVLLKLINLAVF